MHSPAARPTSLLGSVRPYFERAPLAAFALGVASGTPYTLLAATLTTRLGREGINIRSVAAFALVLLLYNFKVVWAPLVDRYGRRTTWITVVGLALVAAIAAFGALDPRVSIATFAAAAIGVGFLGATYDIAIDAYRIELQTPAQLGVAAGMNQYGYQVGFLAVGAIALELARPHDWSLAYLVGGLFVLPAVLAAGLLGEAPYRQPIPPGARRSLLQPFIEFLTRPGALIILAFVIFHRLGDTLANLSLRLLLTHSGFTNDEIARYDVGVGGIAFLVGVFVGGLIYTRLGLKRAVIVSLALIAVHHLGYVWLAYHGHSNLGLAAAITLENSTRGVAGMTIVAFLSALCDTRFTATQYALLSTAASVLGRLVQGTLAGSSIERLGFTGFYWVTVGLSVPGLILFLWMARTGIVDRAVTRGD